MRPLTTKYANDCQECGAHHPIGSQVIYEKRVGIFCLDCAPTDTEDIRAVRQEAADRKATRYEEWADKRRAKAQALETRNDPYRGDIAFNTQPGHIPERARAIKRTERAWEHTKKANQMAGKAQALRSGVRVKGDADRKREAQREFVRGWIEKGMTVQAHPYGLGVVLRVNKKTATIGETGTSGTFKVAVDLSFICRVKAVA